MKKNSKKKILRLSSETLYSLGNNGAGVGNAPCTANTGMHSCCP